MPRRLRQIVRPGGGFTLIELMVSIAIALVLILAVNQVFRITADTIGAGQALGSTVRDYRAVQSVLYNDLMLAVPPQGLNGAALDDGPFLVIRSERMTMFRNRGDQGGDRDGNPATLDLNGNNTEGEANVPGEVVRTTDLGDRSHRLDRLMFFARGLFRRQTGGSVATAGSSPFEAELSSTEGLLWYGHLGLPDHGAPVADKRRFASRRPGELVPGAPPVGQPQPHNPLNFYAADWALGRVVVALAEGIDTNGDGVGDVIKDDHGDDQLFYGRNEPLLSSGSLAPIFANVGAGGPGAVRSSDGWELEWCRYDLANTSMQQYRQILGRYSVANPSPGARAWYNLVSALQFQADPLPGRPLTAAGAARTVPIFLPHCSQFVVEYAGDFVTQTSADPYSGQSDDHDGEVTANVPDDRIDFVALPNPNSNNRIHNIRWYGLPRDTNGDGKVPGGKANANEMPDVVPLRDVRRTARTRQPGETDEAKFERMYDGSGRPRLPLPASGDYARSMAPDASYVLAWGPDTSDQPRPMMLRIVLSIDDPAGKLNSAQTYEYIIKLP